MILIQNDGRMQKIVWQDDFGRMIKKIKKIGSTILAQYHKRNSTVLKWYCQKG